MTRLSVANRLRIGLALMLALLVAAYVLALRQAPPDATRLAQALQATDARRSAVAAMQASADESWLAVNAYLRARDEKLLEDLEQADRAFAAALERYAGGAEDAALRRLAREIGEHHARYSGLARQLVQAGAAPDSVESFYGYQQRVLRALLSDMPPLRGGRATGRTARKQEAAQQLREMLQGRLQLLARGAPAGPVTDAQALIAAVVRYQTFADTAAERAWAERALRALRDTEQQAGAVSGAQREQRAIVDRTQAAHGALQALLTQRAQASAGADVATLIDEGTLGARRANARLADALLALAGAGLLVALVTIWAVRAPLRRLAASTRGYVGDLSFLNLAAPGDEVAELKWALSRLTDKGAAEALRADTPAEAGAPGDARMRQAALAFERSSQAMLLTDERLGILVSNAAFTELTGYDAAEVEGASPAMLLSPDHHDAAAAAAIWAQVDARGAWEGEIVVKSKSGDLHPAWMVVTALRDAQGMFQHALVVLADRAAMHAGRDERLGSVPLRGIEREPIAGATRARVAEAIAACAPDACSVAILQLRVGSVRTVSEALGEAEARQLLVQIRARLQQALGERGEVLDNDGHEPTLLIVPAPGSEALARIARDVLAALCASAARLDGLELPLVAGIGIAAAPEDGDSAEALFAAAGAAMERAAADRDGAYAFASEALTARMRERLALQDDLLNAGLAEQLVLHYQPMLALDSGKAVGVEALLRWRHPTRGLLTPEAFLGEAQAMGVLPDLGAWVLRTACAQARRWIDGGLALRMAVNLSRAELESATLEQRVREALESSGLEPALLQLEVREESLDRIPDIDAALGALKRLGVTLALASDEDSDAVTRALTWLPFTRMKLRAPVRTAAGPPGIVALARNLGVRVVAERVETESQAAAMRAQGVDELQGFVVGRPVAAREFEMRLRHASGRAAPAGVAAEASPAPADS